MKKILLDTNIAVLFIVGLTDRSFIAKHKRLDKYDELDFILVSDVIRGFSRVIVSPNVLAETSNLARQAPSIDMKNKISATLKLFIEGAEEQYVESRQASLRAEYIRLGITDSVLLELAATGAVLLTDDLDLYIAASNAGFEVINYTYIQRERPDFR